MDPATELHRLEALLLDAFSSSELELHLDRWQPSASLAVVRPQGVSPQQYVHSLVSELWRRRLWTGERGFLRYLAAERRHRRGEFIDLLTGLNPTETPEVPPAAPPARPDELAGAIIIERVTASLVDLLALVDERLRRSLEPFWRDGADIFAPLRPGADRRLCVGARPDGFIVEATPRLIQAGQVLTSSIAHVVPHSGRPPIHYTYCPRGRSVRQAFSLALACGRCTLSGSRDGELRSLQLDFMQ